MQKTLKTCSRCGNPIRVERSIPASEVVCGRCEPEGIPELPTLQPEPPPNDTRMTGAGLILFALGLMTVVASGLVNSGLPKVPNSGVDLLRSVSNCGLMLGYALIAIASLLSLFVPADSRAAKVVVAALLMFLVVVMSRVLIDTGLAGQSFVIVWAGAAVAWTVLWSVYVLRVSEVVNRADLGRRLAMVLPLPGLCLSIAWAANWLQAWQESLALIRPAAFCIAMYVGWIAIRLGCVFLDRAADHSGELQQSEHEQLQPS